MGPIVLVMSYGSTKPIEIVQKIQAAKNNSNELNDTQAIAVGETTYSAHKHIIKNKYFETSVNLLPFEDPISTLPAEILKDTEAIIIAFDSTDKSFLIHVPKLCELVENNKIELSLLITTELKDDIHEGLSYADIKEICKTNFDVIETKSSDNDNDDDDGDGYDDGNETLKSNNSGDYSEIIEALENHVWSNVESAAGCSKKTKSSKTAEKSADGAGDSDANDDDENLDEEQLEAYENLLTNIVNFKANSANLNRDQVLDQAEKLAQMFSTFMGDD